MKLGPIYAISKNNKIKEWIACVTDCGETSKLEVFTGYIDARTTGDMTAREAGFEFDPYSIGKMKKTQIITTRYEYETA